MFQKLVCFFFFWYMWSFIKLITLTMVMTTVTFFHELRSQNNYSFSTSVLFISYLIIDRLMFAGMRYLPPFFPTHIHSESSGQTLTKKTIIKAQKMTPPKLIFSHHSKISKVFWKASWVRFSLCLLRMMQRSYRQHRCNNKLFCCDSTTEYWVLVQAYIDLNQSCSIYIAWGA